MTETSEIHGGKTPWHLWAVGIVAILWNAYGCLDFTMTQLQGEVWLRAMKMTEAQIAAFAAMPAWTHVAWAVGVWGGALGGVLLLLRRKWALPAFIASFAGFLAGLLHVYVLEPEASLMPEGVWAMQLVIGTACVLFILYAWRQSRRGILR